MNDIEERESDTHVIQKTIPILPQLEHLKVTELSSVFQVCWCCDLIFLY